MSRTWLVTPAFIKAALLKDFFEHIYSTPPEGLEAHVVVDGNYPINKEQNSAEIKRLCEQYGCRYLNPGKDLGLQENLNHAIVECGIKSGDIFVGCDGDDRPSPGFVSALREVMLADPSVAVAALNFWVIDQRHREGVFKEGSIAGHRVWVHPGVEMFSCVSFNMKLVFSVGGFSQPNAYYGGIEIALYNSWKPMGMKLVYLPDVRSDAKEVSRTNTAWFDPEYRDWKTAHVAGYKGSFGEWLKENNRNAV